MASKLYHIYPKFVENKILNQRGARPKPPSTIPDSAPRTSLDPTPVLVSLCPSFILAGI